MKKRILAAVLPLLAALFLGGCYDQQIFENTAIILYAGAESGENGGLLFSFAAAEATEKDGSLLILSREDQLMEHAIASLNSASGDPLKAGKIQNMLFSEELAQKGIMQVKDANHLETSNRFLADYAIVEGSPKTLLKVLESKEKKNRSYGYLEELLENAANAGLCPNTLHHEFNIDFQTEGKDPILPLLRYDEEKKIIAVKGTALFSEDRCVETLDTAESCYLSILTASAKNIAVKLSNIQAEAEECTLNITECSRKTDLDIINDRLCITIRLKMKSYFTVSNWAELSHTSRNQIEKDTEKAMEKQCTEVFQKMQASGSDPLGIGAKTRGYYNDFYKTHDMDRVYKYAVVRVEIQNTILNQNNT